MQLINLNIQLIFFRFIRCRFRGKNSVKKNNIELNIKNKRTKGVKNGDGGSL